MAKESILIVEDNVGLVELLRDVLQPLNYRLSFALDGRQGLEKALAEHPDLILMDLNLPQMSGIKVLEALRKHGCDSAVILMTAYGSEDTAVRAFRLGVWNYVTKPFKVSEILTLIEQALNDRRLRRERERLVAELSRTNRVLSRRVRELATLHAVGRSVSSLMTVDKLLRRIVDAALRITEADIGAIFLPDESTGELRLEALCKDRSFFPCPTDGHPDHNAGQVLRSGRPLWVTPSNDGECFVASIECEANLALYVPIKLGSRVVGVMGVAYISDPQVPRSEVEGQLTALADYVAIALNNAQLYEELQQQTRQLVTLNRIARMVTSSLEMDEVMQAVVRSVNQILRVETGSLVLLDEETDELIFMVTLRGDTAKFAHFRLKVDQGIVGWVVQHGQPVRVKDASQDPRFYPIVDRVTEFRTRSVLCVPLIIPGKVIGAIEVVNKIDESSPDGIGEFTEQDESLLMAVAAFVAMAIENARLHHAMRKAVAVQTLHETVVTLAHHVNNPLQVLLSISQLLKARLNNSQIPDVIEHETQKIAAAIAVLRELTSPQSVSYMGSTHMLDIEKSLQEKLASLDTGELSREQLTWDL